MNTENVTFLSLIMNKTARKANESHLKTMYLLNCFYPQVNWVPVFAQPISQCQPGTDTAKQTCLGIADKNVNKWMRLVHN